MQSLFLSSPNLLFIKAANNNTIKGLTRKGLSICLIHSTFTFSALVMKR